MRATTNEVDLSRVLKIMSRKQIKSIFECNARINVWHGAVSSGKTIASLLALIFAIVNAPANGVIFICGRTLDTIERNIFEPLMQPFGPFGPFARYIKHTAGATRATIFGRTVHLVGAANVLAEDRIRGATAALIYIDEATLIPEPFWNMALSRLRVPGAKLIATTNPDGPAHWLRKKFLLRRELNLRQWQFTLADNPSLTPDYITDLCNEYVGLWYRRFIKGEWCLAHGAIYDMWDPKYHVVTQLPPITDWVGVGVDHGVTNAFAAELIGLGSDGVLYVASEYHHDPAVKRRKLSDFEYAKNMIEWLDRVPIPGSALTGVRPKWTAIDPSAATFRQELLRLGMPSVAADNDVMGGIRLTASLLATQRLKVHASCEGLINEFPGYSWDEKQAEKGIDEPIKADDHCLDGKRYGVKTTQATYINKLRKPVLLPAY